VDAQAEGSPPAFNKAAHHSHALLLQNHQGRLAPNFFLLWDNAIANSYGVVTETRYFQFMNIVKQQVLTLPEEIVPGVAALKGLGEYNDLETIG